MASARPETLVVANPRAGRGRDLAALRAELERAGVDADVVATETRGHGVALARQARQDGRTLVVAAGGDGTVHEVVNGLLADGPGPDVPALGVVPLGSGCDYVRTFGIPADLPGAVSVLAGAAEPVTVDAAEVTCRTGDGQRAIRFANIAEVGLGSAVVDRAARLPRRLGPAVYFAAFWLTLPGFRRPSGSVTCDGHPYEGPVTNLVVAVGKAFGGGMLVAPGADPSDGLFDVQVQWGSKLDYMRSIPKVYRGRHVPHPKILERRAAVVEVRCVPDVLIEADGEVLGSTPATFRVLPGALRLKVLSANL